MAAYILLFNALIFANFLFSHEDGAYYHGTSDISPQKDWMKKLPDYRRLSKISMPGTHDTASFHGGDITQTQTLSLKQQLEAGIRFLDIRIKHENNKFEIYHGIQYQYTTFEKVLSDVSDFLKNNPSEVILMRVSHTGDPKGNNRSFEDTYKEYLSTYQDFVAYPNKNYDPMLCQVRGKIILFPTDKLPILETWGLNYYMAFDAQDAYHLVSNWDLYEKWEKVRNHLNKANDNKSLKKIFLNYLSGSGGSFPYFVASGHSSPGTDASRLSTGVVTLSKDKYPDFPRVACLKDLCTIVFEGTNTLTKDYLLKNRQKLKYVGVVIADFPGKDLIDAIIKINPFGFDAALGDRQGACDPLLQFSSKEPLLCTKINNDQSLKKLKEKPFASWSSDDQKSAINVLKQIIAIRPDVLAKLSKEEIQAILKMDCDAIKKEGNYMKITNIPAQKLSDNERNTAIVIITRVLKLPLQFLQGLNNTELKEFLKGF